MAKAFDTYQLIADIISQNTDTTVLKQKLSSPEINWENLVKVASKHLILPTVYCNIKKRELAHSIPSDLNQYLKEITEINGNRNLTILNEVKTIAQLFNEHGINYVFLKGCALMVGEYHENNAERMIGDIDILVENDQIQFANSLLLKNGYEVADKRLSYDFYSQKHLPRLLPKNGMAAVELHDKLLRKPRPNELTEHEVLLNKQHIDGVKIPSTHDLFKHMVLSVMHDDRANYFQSISFKCNYDCLILLRTDLIDQSIYKSNFCKSYFLRNSFLFDEFKFDTINNTEKLVLKFNRFKLRNNSFQRIWYQLLGTFRYLGIYLSRLNLFVTNKKYRALVFQRKPLKINNIDKVL